MVIGDANVAGVSGFPTEDNTPLLVDADAPKAFEVSREGFEAVGWWEAKLVKGCGAVNLAQLHQGSCLNAAGKLAGGFTPKDFLGFLAGKTQEHDAVLSKLITPARGKVKPSPDPPIPRSLHFFGG
jgi:hypothetical protein